MKRKPLILFLTGSTLSLIWGIISLYIGVQMNNQNEFYNFESGPWTIKSWDIVYLLQHLLYPLFTWIAAFSIGLGIAKLLKNKAR